MFTQSFISEINYACGMWACHYGKHSKFSTMQCRKCKFVLIDVEVGILPTSLATMKAMVRLYQKYASIFQCLHVKKLAFFKYLLSKYPLKYKSFKNPHRTRLDMWTRTPYPERNCHFSVKTVLCKRHFKLYSNFAPFLNQLSIIYIHSKLYIHIL